MNSAVEKSLNQNYDSKIWIFKFIVLRRNSIHLILHETLIAIAQLLDLMIFNPMDVGTIGKDIISPI